MPFPNLFGRKPDVADTPTALRLSGSVDLEAAKGDDKRPTMRLTAYTGESLSVAGFYANVVIDLAGAEFDRNPTPIIADHSTDKRIGHTTDQSVSAKGIFAEGIVSSDMDVAREFVADAKRGYPFQVSVGAEVVERYFVEAGSTAELNGRSYPGPVIVAKRVRIKELSITVLGADSKTKAEVNASANKTHQKETDMPLTPEVIDAVLAPPRSGWDYLRDEADQLRAKALNGELTVTQLAEEATRLRARADFSKRLRDETTLPAPTYNRHTEANLDKRAIAASLLCRLGKESLAEATFGEVVMECSKPLHSASLLELCKASLMIDGHQVPSNRNEMLRASLGFSNATLPEAISDVVHSILRQQYAELNQSWRSFCSIKIASDFRDHQALRLDVGGNMDVTGEHGEIKHSTIAADQLTYSVQTISKQLRIGRQTLINDHVDILAEIPMVFARMSARKIADIVYQTLLSAGSHYSSGNGNSLSGATSVLDIDSLGDAITLMRKQRSSDNDDLDISPRVLLVPPELQATAQAVLESEFLERAVSTTDSVDKQPSGNPFRRSLKLEIESRLSNTDKFSSASATAWYLMAGSVDVPMIVAFLNGSEFPTIEYHGLDSDINTLGVSFRIFHDVGAALGDPKASVRSAGA